MTEFVKTLRRRRIARSLVFGEADIRALTGIACDSACLEVAADGGCSLYTDFRYEPMVRRTAPWLAVGDLRRYLARTVRSTERIGYEGSVPHRRFLALSRRFRGAAFVDIEESLQLLRAVKTPGELERIRAAARLNDEIWQAATERFGAGMTEAEMARIIRSLMSERGDGEAFPTIVCVGANAAECHHVPDATVWNGRDPVLVDMGVKLDGFCSDMTRNLVPKRARPLYRRVYGLVLEANRRATAAVRAGVTCGEIDRVARSFLDENGFGKAFGHSLGHGVGLEIHEQPYAAKGRRTVLRPGMTLTIEPGVYLEGNLGVRIEDLVIVTETGCETLTHSGK